MTDLTPQDQGEFVLFQTDDGSTRIQCRFENETIWLTQATIAELFQTTPQNITLHLKAIYTEGELTEEETCKDYLQVRSEGSRQVQRNLKHYNLEAILAVGYRVQSQRGTQFRQWATAKLGEYLVKGFVMDDERLRNPPAPGVPDYFDEMLERIRDIRASERRMYLRLRDILALAADYKPTDEDTHTFFQTVQNKLHFAISGHTAPELIVERADHSKPNMGVTTFKGKVVRKADVTVAKNYLNEEEISELNRVVTMFLDYAEDQASRRKQVFLKDWQERLDSWLQFNDRKVLPGPGHVSREAADRKALAEYGLFEVRRREAIEAQAEAKLVQDLEDAVKKLPRKL
jgi:hypothetical protein